MSSAPKPAGFRRRNSPTASAGDDAPPMPPDTGQGTGYRIVYSRAMQRVWAVNDNEQVVRSYLVTGSQFNNEMPGKHKVYSKSEMTTGWNGQADLPLTTASTAEIRFLNLVGDRYLALEEGEPFQLSLVCV